MITSFRDREAERVFKRWTSRKLPAEIQRVAYRKLMIIHHANSLSDLRIPPGNHLERLRGDRTGQYSVRINNRWRVCFEWHDGRADAVEIVDYH